ncbi:MAG: hypothetical protein K0S53_3384 [Bacteroidetes bacterium]|nr:hypothetical protein [Bacteroidota bacterium]MDF2451416.1 hypothetical protein [Bacteroidota bacterium]
MTIDTSIYHVIESHSDNISTIQFWDNGIISIRLKDNVQVELEDSLKQYNYLKSKYDGKNKHLILVESGVYTSISKEAREFATKPESNEMTMATAVIVKSLAHRIIINFIINITNQQKMKMRMFEDRQKAINWLLSFKNT